MAAIRSPTIVEKVTVGPKCSYSALTLIGPRALARLPAAVSRPIIVPCVCVCVCVCECVCVCVHVFK